MRKVTIKNTNGEKSYNKTFDKIDNNAEVTNTAYQSFTNSAIALMEGRTAMKITVTEYTERDVALA